MVDRIATFTHSQSLNSSNMRLQGEYATGQTQLSSGMKSDSYEGIAKDSSQILSLESDYKAILSTSENAQTALDRTEIVYDKMGSIVTVGQSFLDDLNAAISGTGVDQEELVAMAQQMLDQVTSLMNSQSSGRYVFSGSATQTAPVDMDNYTGTDGITLPSVADTSYYAGNDYVQSVEISDGFSVKYGVTGDNEAFEKIIRALDLVINSETIYNADGELDPEAALTEAFDLLGDGLDDMAVAKAQTSQDSQTLDTFINDSLSELNLIDTLIANLKEVDLTEVTLRLQELETQLEASYTVTSKLLNLKLSDYI